MYNNISRFQVFLHIIGDVVFETARLLKKYEIQATLQSEGASS
jgi:hypothetical protein